MNDTKPSLRAVATPASQSSIKPSHTPLGKPGFLSRFAISGQLGRQLVILLITSVAIYQAGRSIVGSCQRQVYLHQQSNALKDGRRQAEEINKELRDGLSSYRSSTGIERLARERLNLAGPDEIVIRIGK